MKEKMVIQIVTQECTNMRLDRWIKRHFKGFNQSFIEKNLRLQAIRVNGLKASSNFRLSAADEVSFQKSCLSAAPPSERLPFSSPALQETAAEIGDWIVYQDDAFLILNKPQGLASQGGTGIKTSADTALNLWLQSQNKKGYLVHRLDKDTTGLLLVALTPRIATQLGALLAERQISKTYWALGVGTLSPQEGVWENWMAKRPGAAGEKMEILTSDSPKALKARCRYRVRGVQEELSLVELSPETGRMHQIRLQMAHHGCPVLGDGKYGGAGAHPWGRTTLHLHAGALSFEHPQTQKPFSFEVPLPPHFEKTLRQKGFSVSKKAGEKQ